MNIPDELLAAYADGELQGAERARIEHAIAHDARLAQRLAHYRTLHARLRGSFERPRLLQPHRLAIAASIVGGLLVGAVAERFWSSGDSGALTEYHNGALVARGALADTLSRQLTDVPAPDSRFHVGMSFRAKAGNYCRTFSATDNPALAGLACHEQEDWRILTLVGSQPAARDTGPSNYVAEAERRVSWNLSPLLLQTVREHIAGEPLDAQAETRARGSDWR
jgi:hypothetical protein